MTTNSDPLIGKTLGSYQVIEAIGQGGMARIYKGYHAELNRYAAIKIVNWGLAEDPDFTGRFRREAQAIARLRHPNIVQIFDFGKYEQGHFMAMEFIKGHDLAILLRQYKKQEALLPKEQVLSIITDNAAALDHAHNQGVIHRDVKPSNVMINQAGQAILTDFGLVMLAGSKSQATRGSTFGTPHYIAPEQAISSAAAVKASDIYSLGVILYEMVTGQLLFDDESPLSIALKHISDKPMPPTAINPDLPHAVEEVVLMALAKEPADRFASATALATALRSAWNKTPGKDRVSSSSMPVLPAGVPPAAEVSKITLPDAAVVTAVPPVQPPPEKKSSLRWGLLALASGIIIGALAIFLIVNSNFTTPPEPTPSSAKIAASPTATTIATATLTATTANTLALPSATPTSTPLPTHTPSPILTATPTNTSTPEPTTTPTATSSPTPLPLPTPTASGGVLTLDQLQGKILFKTDRSGRGTEIYRMNADGSNQQPLARENWSLYADLEKELPLSANKQEVIAMRGEGQLDLWRSNLVTGQELRVTSTGQNEYDPAWSPMDNRIAYVSEKTGRGDIYVLNLDGSADTRLTENLDNFDKHPTWSPDGQKIAFWSDRGVNNTRQIWLIDLAGNQLTSLSDNPFNDWDPVWVH